MKKRVGIWVRGDNNIIIRNYIKDYDIPILVEGKKNFVAKNVAVYKSKLQKLLEILSKTLDIARTVIKRKFFG